MEIRNRFQLFVALICVQVYTSTCDDLVPMLTDGEFTQAVAIIESKLDEIPQASDGTITTELTEVAGDDSVSYFTAEDQEHPVFKRMGGKPGEKTIVLSRGEDHFLNEDRNDFAVLVQTGGSKYTLHVAYIDDLDSGELEWFHAIASVVDGAEIVLELFGNHEHEERQDHCHWFGQTLLMCSVMTLQEKTDMQESSEMDEDGEDEGNDARASGSSYSTKQKKEKRPIGEGLVIPDGSEWKKKNAEGATATGDGMDGAGTSKNNGIHGDNSKPDKSKGTSGKFGGKPGEAAEAGESEEQTYITLKVGDKSKAKGRQLGTMITRKGRTMPKNKVSKRQSPDFLPRYHTMW